MPSCPNSPRPQHQAAPLVVSPQVCAPPTATEVNVNEATVTAAVPVFPCAVAVMLAEPSASPVSTPAGETVATAEGLVVQVTWEGGITVPFWSLAKSCRVCPATMLTSLGNTVTLVIPESGPAGSDPPQAARQRRKKGTDRSRVTAIPPPAPAPSALLRS